MKVTCGSCWGVFIVVGVVVTAGLHGPQHGMPIFRLIEEYKDVPIEQVPWQVAILDSTSLHLLCGGAIITRYHVLTAAHCTDKITSSLLVRYGTTDWQTGGTTIDVYDVVRHPMYNPLTFDNDLAVVKLSKPVEITEKHKPIKLAKKSLQFGRDGQITGWNEANILQNLFTTIGNLTSCQDFYADSGMPISDSMFCAVGYNREEVDFCNGDKGSGLTKSDVLYGVSSWGFGCRVPEAMFYDVYVRVDVARWFIDESTDFKVEWV